MEGVKVMLMEEERKRLNQEILRVRIDGTGVGRKEKKESRVRTRFQL